MSKRILLFGRKDILFYWELSEQYFRRWNFAPLSVDKDALTKESVIYAITINGKKRAEVEMPLGLSKEEIIIQAKESVPKWLEGVEILKEIIVPNKLVNLVVK